MNATKNIHVNTNTSVVTVEIRNIDDGIVWSRKFDLNQDLVYNSNKQNKNDKLCEWI